MQLFNKVKLITALIFKLFFLNIKAVDLVVFSYDRPMQLYALLESCDLYITGASSKTVIYRTSAKEYQAGYDLVQAKFKDISFLKQQNPPHDFKNLTQEVFQATSSKYIMFAVDDLFVKTAVNLFECIDLLEKFKAYTFSLRLSPNINYCYSARKYTPAPKLQLISYDAYMHNFKNGQGDWCYPNSVDMNIYRKQEIYQNLFLTNWNCPNLLEGVWAARANLNQNGLCYSESKVVNIPLNLVQNLIQNYAMHSYSPAELLKLFMQGQKINLEPISKLKNNSVHVDFDIDFIKR